MIDEMDTPESLNPEESEETINLQGEGEPESPEVDIEGLKKRASLADDYKVRAEIAERKLKQQLKVQPKTEETKEVPQDFSPKDFLALNQAGITADDLDEVIDYAKYKGISISEAVKNPVVKTILKERAEERKTAEATNVGTARKGTQKVTGESLLEKASRTGEMPETDEGMAELAKARLESKMSKT